jgi:hypothetical protein
MLFCVMNRSSLPQRFGTGVCWMFEVCYMTGTRHPRRSSGHATVARMHKSWDRCGCVRFSSLVTLVRNSRVLRANVKVGG